MWLYISNCDPVLWEIDVNNYNNKNIDLILKTYNDIFKALKEYNYKPSNTLITKIMLGVFSNIPAFDRYVKNTFKINVVNKKNLKKLYGHYLNNKEVYDSYKVFTFDYNNNKATTKNKYKIAKLIDMYGFAKNYNK